MTVLEKHWETLLTLLQVGVGKCIIEKCGEWTHNVQRVGNVGKKTKKIWLIRREDSCKRTQKEELS